MTHIRCGTPGCGWKVPRLDIELCYVGLRAHCIERHGLDPIDEDRYFFFDLEGGTFTLLPVVESQHRIPVLRVETAVGKGIRKHVVDAKPAFPAAGGASKLLCATRRAPTCNRHRCRYLRGA